MTTGDRIKACRKELGFSAEFVAEKLGVSPATVYRYENGDIEKVPAGTLIRLADILGTSTEYLLGLDSPAPDALLAALLGRAISGGGLVKDIISDLFKLSPEQLSMLSKIISAMLDNK